ncbi:hypothetical protein LIER_41278 [Lithospermum erythrorhizon]|uniref:Retrotransposon gag domain-containing protein n=1 Tax=Lithospermum erythrorhizon TaxID=34254 RepID=A0AAV3RAV8_LITER
MSKDLAKGFSYASDAFGLSEEIRQQFGGYIEPRLYEIRRSIYYAKQGKDSVACFYNKLKTLWEELMSLKPRMRFGDFEELHTLETGSVMAMQVVPRFGQKNQFKRNIDSRVHFQGFKNQQQQFASRNKGQGFVKEDKYAYRCDFYGRRGHLKRDYFKIKGFPD